MLPASIVPKSGQVLRSHHCRVSSMTYLLHLHMMIRQMVSRGLVYPQRVSRLTYTAPAFLVGEKGLDAEALVIPATRLLCGREIADQGQGLLIPLGPTTQHHAGAIRLTGDIDL